MLSLFAAIRRLNHTVLESTMPKTKRWHPSQESDELIFAVCDRFLAQLGKPFEGGEAVETETERRGAAAAIAEWLREEYDRKDLTREKIYPLFWEAARRNFLFLHPPREKRLAKRLAERYSVGAQGDNIQVINAPGANAARHVTSAAADTVLTLVDRVAKAKNANLKPGEKRKAVHIGMGAGFATMLVAQRLAQRIYSDVDCPPLVLHALSAGGFLVNDPQKSPVTYFGYFSEVLPKVEFVALFSETVVGSDDYEKMKKNPSIRRSFERRGEIDIIITSLADAHHEHGLLGQFLTHLVDEEMLHEDALQTMWDAGWCGDVQFRPYSPEGPLSDVCPVRAVTLFELDELVEMASKKDKYVVLVAGPCGECGASKRDAIRPLLAQPNLRLWTHLVTDVQTARELLD